MPPDATLATRPPWRVAAISFLNTAPLLWGLEQEPRLQLIASLPAQCADRLRAGEADLGLIPVIELARIAGLRTLPGICIAARRQVRSILLISRCPPAAIRTLRLDPASRTSAALAQILLRRRWGAEFHLLAEPAPGAAWRARLSGADAALLIGDPALRLWISGAAARAGFQVFDLAAAWHAWTGLPFVFALWAVRRSALATAADAAWLSARLARACDEGFAHLHALSQTWSRRLRLPPGEIQQYLSRNLEHRWRPDHAAGLERFLELAAAQGLVASATIPAMALCEMQS